MCLAAGGVCMPGSLAAGGDDTTPTMQASPASSPTSVRPAHYKSALVTKERKPEVVTLGGGDLQRMLSDAPFMMAEQASSMRHAAEQRQEQQRAAAKARKEKMLRLEAEVRQQVSAAAHAAWLAARDGSSRSTTTTTTTLAQATRTRAGAC